MIQKYTITVVGYENGKRVVETIDFFEDYPEEEAQTTKKTCDTCCDGDDYGDEEEDCYEDKD